MRWKTLKEGLPFALPLAVTVALAAAFVPWLNWVLVPLLVFTLAFFRDPDRLPPPGEAIAVAPADGRVTDVGAAPNPLDPTAPEMLRIGIFLSIFDVHVNRMPLAGRVVSTHEEIGEFLDARHPDAGTRNARRTWLIASPHGGIIVRQITGAVARRIVAWAVPGQSLARAERIGMIRFGSRTELYLPAGFAPLVHPRDTVRGGRTPVAQAASPDGNS